jgi:hypothetical protein
MLEKLKQNISEITAVASLSFALIGGAIAVESRYARIEDVEKNQKHRNQRPYKNEDRTKHRSRQPKKANRRG